MVAPAGAPVVLRAAGRRDRAGVVDGFGDRLAGDLGVTDLVAGWGGLVLRDVPAGPVQVEVGGPLPATQDLVVPRLGERPADYERRVLGQRLEPGYGYLEVRDGTLLSVNVALPDPERWGRGPHPTVLQYSGYHPSRPDFLTGDPVHDTGMNTEANLCLHLGYAVVGVNMRGSGGSGGAFQLLSPVAGLDGHDAVEVVARQPWARRRADGRPGVAMVGRSMPGYSQVLVASTRPPSLVAITPASIGSHPYDAMAPGGVTNAWLQAHIGFWEVDPVRAGPVASGMGVEGGRYEFWDAWLRDRIAEGDEVAAWNQLLRGQNVDLGPLLEGYGTPDADRALAIDIGEWAERVEATTMVLGTWQDQDSGAGFGMVPPRFPDTTEVRVLAANGTHEEPRLPALVGGWTELLAVRLRGEAPRWTDEAQEYLDACYADRFPEGLPLPRSPLEGLADAEAVAAFDARPPVRVLLELGAGPDTPSGYPYPSTHLDLDRWPPPAEPTSFALHAGGLAPAGAAPPAGPPATGFRYDPRALLPASAHPGFDVNGPDPPYDWRPLPAGYSAGFATDPLAEDLLLVGPASLDVWVCCTAPDVDLEVTLTEVRPDGAEVFVQSGWLRAGRRALDPDRSTALVPWLLEEQWPAPLSPGEPVAVRVPVGWFGHLFRAGSRLRVCVAAPGGNQPHWSFAPRWPDGRCHGAAVEVELLHDAAHPSALVVPRLDVDPPGGAWPPLPPAGALRRQPARPYRPAGVAVDPEVGPAPPPPGAPDPADEPGAPGAPGAPEPSDEPGAPGAPAEPEGWDAEEPEPAASPPVARPAWRRVAGRVRRVAGRVRRVLAGRLERR